ncbi:MAG TPA: right-handed parallel beta-helix repeat-containing protein [Rudaea sp.]|nr:right-handed parallel beta-helix repeat-containing protein [Rudaea sp.]
MESKLLRPLSQAVALALAAGGAHAASITVTDGGDAGTASSCTLRQAIVSANTDSVQGTCTPGSGADTITFAAGLANATIALQYGQLLIDSSVTISGSGQTITAASGSRVMGIYGNANTTPVVNLTGLTLSGGSTFYTGAGLLISDYAPALGRPTPLSHRHAPPGNTPAAPVSAPMVTLDHVAISGNTSTANAQAAGVYIHASTVAINYSTISGNTLTTASNYGAGGIYVTNGISSGSTVTITNSTISGNRAGGSAAYLTGGLYTYESNVTIINSTLTGNSATGADELAGGLSVSSVYGGYVTTLYDSTVSGNVANSIGGGTYVAGGALVGAFRGGFLVLNNTIVSGNQGATDPDISVVSGATLQSSYGLLGTALQATFSGNGNVFSDAPGLGTLANNGGPTLTMLPQAGSPALGAGNAALIPSGVTTDQRGAGFPRVTNGILDIGAVQAPAAPIAAPTPAPALSRWAMLALGGMLGLFGLRKRRRTG